MFVCRVSCKINVHETFLDLEGGSLCVEKRRGCVDKENLDISYKVSILREIKKLPVEGWWLNLKYSKFDAPKGQIHSVTAKSEMMRFHT